MNIDGVKGQGQIDLICIFVLIHNASYISMRHGLIYIIMNNTEASRLSVRKWHHLKKKKKLKSF